MKKPTLLVLAAGMGSRYGGLKQIDAMGPHGEWLLDYSVYDALRAGFGKVVFVIRESFKEEFVKQVGDRFADQLEVATVCQELQNLPDGYKVPKDREKPWGTAHAIMMANEVINENFAVINSDDYYGIDSYKCIFDYFMQSENKSEQEYCMVGYPLKNTLSPHGTVNRGVCQSDENGYLQSVLEQEKIEITEGGARCPKIEGGWTNFTGDEPASMNLWGFTPNIFNELDEKMKIFLDQRGQELKSEIYIPSVVDELIRDKKASVKVLHSNSQWFGVTYPEDKQKVVNNIEALIQQGAYPSKLWK